MSMSLSSPSSTLLLTALPTDGVGSSQSHGSTLGTAAYYGAIAVIVFILICITFTSRMVVKKKTERIAFQLREQRRLREQEERNAMERRGEESGLPTYRQSAHEATMNHAVTEPPLAHVNDRPHQTVAPPPYRPPPKYDDAGDEGDGDGDGMNMAARMSRELGRGGQAIDAEDPHEHDVTMMEMSQVSSPVAVGSLLPLPFALSTTPTTSADTVVNNGHGHGRGETTSEFDDVTAYERRTRAQGGLGRLSPDEPTLRPTHTDDMNSTSYDPPYRQDAVAIPTPRRRHDHDHTMRSQVNDQSTNLSRGLGSLFGLGKFWSSSHTQQQQQQPQRTYPRPSRYDEENPAPHSD